MRASRPVPLVILDCDGVLVDSESIAVPIQAHALRSAGVDVTDHECARLLVGRSREEGYALLRETYGFRPTEQWKASLHVEVSQALTSRLHESEGASRLLRRLDRLGIPWCVATNGTRESTERKLSASGLARYCADDRVFCVEDVTCGKPAPDLFLLAAARCGAETRRAVVVEDSLQGLQAAREAGMHALWYGGHPARSGPGIEVVDQLAQVPEYAMRAVAQEAEVPIHAD